MYYICKIIKLYKTVVNIDTMSKDITKIHDLVFRQSLSHKIVARDLLENHLDKKILDIIDLETLQLCNTSFIDEKIQESISDIV